MFFDIQVLVLTITLTSFSLKATADIIVQPGYGKAPTQHTPTHSQPLITPIQQQQRESNFGNRQAHLIPIYANGYQGAAAYQVGRPLLHYPYYPHYPHYPHYHSYPHYVHAWPRFAPPQRYLHVLKANGRKALQPIHAGHLTNPLAVHHRYKKSVGDQTDTEDSGKTVPNSKDSSLTKSRSDMVEEKGKIVPNQESKNDYATTGTLYNLNSAHLMNPEDLKNKLNALNQRNTDENIELPTKKPESNIDKLSIPKQSQSASHESESNSPIPPDAPNLRNFPDPRPDKSEHKTSLKTTTSIPKNSPDKGPLVGSPMTTGDEILGSKYIQQDYPQSSLYDYVLPQYGNSVTPYVSYLPVYVLRYGGYNDGTPKIYGDQQSTIQEKIHQGIHVMDYYPQINGYVSSPQTCNYVQSYALGYPKTFTYVTSPYSIPYTQFE